MEGGRYYTPTPTIPEARPMAMHSISENRIFGRAGLTAGGTIVLYDVLTDVWRYEYRKKMSD